MAKILCKYSGILFNCEHMPLGLASNEYYHPLFAVPKKRLLALAGEWSANRLSHTESYLLYLSLLNSTNLLVWKAPARFTPNTLSIISQNMESLLQIIGKIDIINHPAFALPRISITYDTGTLDNSFYWIQSWLHGYNEFMSDQVEVRKREELKHRVERREQSLTKLIRTAFLNPQTLANNLAIWAADAGSFPSNNTLHPLTQTQIGLDEYWKELIRACVREEAIWRYPRKDIEELIEHCEENIEHGSIHAHSLMSLLRTGLKKRDNYAGFGDVDLAGKTFTPFRLLRADDTVEDANVIAAIAAAPDVEPKRHMYPSSFAYIRAKANWDLKMKYTAQRPADGDSK
jgi:hypothetical protein